VELVIISNYNHDVCCNMMC